MSSYDDDVIYKQNDLELILRRKDFDKKRLCFFHNNQSKTMKFRNIMECMGSGKIIREIPPVKIIVSYLTTSRLVMMVLHSRVFYNKSRLPMPVILNILSWIGPYREEEIRQFSIFLERTVRHPSLYSQHLFL